MENHLNNSSHTNTITHPRGTWD